MFAGRRSFGKPAIPPKMMTMDFAQYVFGQPYFGWLCRGFLMTILIGLAGCAGGALLGVLSLRCHLGKKRLLRTAAACYVVLFRNLPTVPLLLFLTFALPGIWRATTGAGWPRGLEFHLLLLGLSLNAGPYLSEILRAGVEAVDSRQTDIARTLGLSEKAIGRYVVFPQAVRIVAPALVSRFIHIMKNATLAVVVPLPVQMMEMTGQAGRIAGLTFSWAEPAIFAAAGYLFLALVMGRLLNGWARREHARIGAAP